MTFRKPLILVSIVLLYAVVILSVLLQAGPSFYLDIVRLGALIGYVSVFISTMLTNYIREVRDIFGRPFMRVHHWFGALGLIFMTLHPVVYSIYAASLLVFIPDFSSWYSFWSLAGRQALYIAYIATATALLRTRIPKYWRYLHGLMYVVLVFAFVHGLLIGTDLANPLIAILFLSMLILALAVAIRKRLVKR